MKTWRIGLALLALWGASAALAAPFEVAINPSRFELAGKSGQRIGQSLDINNLNPQATEVALRTLDWSLSDDGQLALYDALQPGSCRPWVVLERPRVTVPGRGKRSFRFQVQVPPDAGRGECRFMIAVEGVEPAQQAVVPDRAPARWPQALQLAARWWWTVCRHRPPRTGTALQR